MATRTRRKYNPAAVQADPPSVWKGPERDGITFSLLSRFLVCRERFRCLVVDGLKPADDFNHRLEFGQMWHTCEESLASGREYRYDLLIYCNALARRYMMRQKEIQKWYNVCIRQFPIYLDYWSKHADTTSRQCLLQEQVFNVPYKLPSGRTVRLRGKWDSVDLIGKGKAASVYLQENKTKGDPNEQQIRRQLTFDLQTMMYLVALHWQVEHPLDGPSHYEALIGQRGKIQGVRYNVIRRPLSGGKGTIVQGKGGEGSKCPKCKGTGYVTPKPPVVRADCQKCAGTGRLHPKPPESDEAYYDRLAKYISDEPANYFMRWQVEVLPQDVAKFRRECLDPILEQLCWWWDWVKGDKSHGPLPSYAQHYTHPFGVYNILDEGGSSDLDEFLMNGSEVGLARTTNLFPELT